MDLNLTLRDSAKASKQDSARISNVALTQKQYDRGQHLVDKARIEGKVFRYGDMADVRKADIEIREQLALAGVDFENRPLPVSMLPTTVSKDEVRKISTGALAIRDVLNRIIDQFIAEHREARPNAPLHRFYAPYEKWFDMIAQERRTLDNIQLMRFDSIRDVHGNWSFMETNTCCPGGVISCANIRRAWLRSSIGQAVIDGEIVEEHAIDSWDGFVRFMADIALSIDPKSPNIAILSHKGFYVNEVESLRKAHARLVANGEIERGILLLGDIEDVQCEADKASLNGVPLALIYNKIDPLTVEPKSPQLSGWLAASRCAGTEFLNSCGSLFLTEAKRVLALLSDPHWRRFVEIGERELAAIMELIPYTRLVESMTSGTETDRGLLLRNRASFVLKADALTRGAGVYIGEAVSPEDWQSTIDEIRALDGVAQLKCNLPSRTNIGADGSLEENEYFGIDYFLFGRRFAGLVSRAHSQQIFNIGSGGKYSPVLIV